MRGRCEAAGQRGLCCDCADCCLEYYTVVCALLIYITVYVYFGKKKPPKVDIYSRSRTRPLSRARLLDLFERTIHSMQPVHLDHYVQYHYTLLSLVLSGT